jgi:transposase
MPTLGIDTHKHVHAVVVLDGLGRRLGGDTFGTDDRDHVQLLRWASAFGPVERAGVEGTGTYGYRLARFLLSHGIEVIEVNRPDRARRRREGKTDLIDAEVAARAVLAEHATVIPKDRTGAVGEIRALLVARRSAVKARTQASNQLKSLLVHVDDDLRERLSHRRMLRLAERTARIHATSGTKRALRSLARRWLALKEEIDDLEREIETLVRTTAPDLLDRPGIAAVTAAQLLVTAGANPQRLKSESAFAALCGASPVQASSGQTNRHRLNRGGDRQANNALWIIAHVRLVHDERSRTYAAKRTALGDNRKEILRRLKRYIAREVYPILIDALAPEPERALT